jgi:hypothetical protein
VECRVEGPRESIGVKSGGGNCLYCTGVDAETVYLNDNHPVDKPLRGGRNYLTNKDTDSPIGSSNQMKLVSKQSELFDLENTKVAGAQAV